MKKFFFLVSLLLINSCSSTKYSSSNVQEEQISVTRKYIGNFISYYHTDPSVIGGTDLIWIETTVYNTFGKISAYGTRCEFIKGEKIYLRPINTGEFGYWEYRIENDSAISYKVSEYRYEGNVFVKRRSL